jgi:plasmid stabilization system protein ParE
VSYRLLPSAISDLSDIDLWSLEHFGLSVADKTQNRFFTTFELLEEAPHLGRERKDVTSRPVRFFFLKPFWIVYEPSVPLLIHRVFHAARDLARIGEDLAG